MIVHSLEQVKKIPLFASIPEADLEKINARLKAIPCTEGEIIISEGEVGDCLYIIRSGQVKVVANSDNEQDDEIVLSFLSDGDYFGEMALITGEPRSATVIAETDVELWQLDKSDFDALMLNNPSITISMTHMLSQRLKLANKAREMSERYYKHQISPRGRLEDVEIIKLLKFAEENSLSGKIYITHGEHKACFDFHKGQLQKLDYEDKDEDQAMDEILNWQEGEFVIEPTIFKISETEEVAPEKVLQDSALVSSFEKYLLEKFVEFIRIAGSRSTQAAVNKSFYKFGKYFSVVEDFQIQTDPRLEIHIHPKEAFTEKHVLFIAVFLRDIIQTLQRDLLMLDFWNVQARETEVDKTLRAQNFYDYYAQALDFVQE